MIQCQFLNKVLKTGDVSPIILNNFTEDYFSDYPQEYRWIKDHYDKYGTCPDIHSFVDKFPDFDVVEVNEPTRYLVDELCTDYGKRKLAKIFNKVRDLLNQDKTEEAMSLYTSAASEVVNSTNMEVVDIFKDTRRFDDYVDRCSDFNKFYIKTGFPELDQCIGGWDRNEELATIVARPGVGKSWILLKVALAAAEQGLNVGLYSGEMSERKVGYRMDTLISHISNSAIMRGKEDVSVAYKKYIEELPTMFKGSIKILTPAMINGVAGVTALRAFVEKEKLDVLGVDQHSLLEDDRHARNPVEKAANISRDLKNLQVIKKIPIIAVSQQNRDSTEGTGQTTANVAQSDRISQDSTVLLFLEQKNNILTLNLVKARDAVNNKKLQYAVNFDTGTFQFIPNEQSENSAQVSQELMDDFDETGDDNAF